ncbi:MAG: 30S ribosomal protein S20 [Myxococcaceae bacterium]
MANTRSAEKRNRQAQKRNVRNTAVRSSVKTALKKAREAIATGDAAKAKDAVKAATRALDKAATKGVLHARNASRHVARLAQAAAEKFAAATK